MFKEKLSLISIYQFFYNLILRQLLRLCACMVKKLLFMIYLNKLSLFENLLTLSSIAGSTIGEN